MGKPKGGRRKSCARRNDKWKVAFQREKICSFLPFAYSSVGVSGCRSAFFFDCLSFCFRNTPECLGWQFWVGSYYLFPLISWGWHPVLGSATLKLSVVHIFFDFSTNPQSWFLYALYRSIWRPHQLPSSSADPRVWALPVLPLWPSLCYWGTLPPHPSTSPRPRCICG